MTQKEIIKTIKLLRKELKKGFGLRCKKQAIDCSECKAMRLDAYLEWWEELEKWDW